METPDLRTPARSARPPRRSSGPTDARPPGLGLPLQQCTTPANNVTQARSRTRHPGLGHRAASGSDYLTLRLQSPVAAGKTFQALTQDFTVTYTATQLAARAAKSRKKEGDREEALQICGVALRGRSLHQCSRSSRSARSGWDLRRDRKLHGAEIQKGSLVPWSRSRPR